jgi:hypothetical protein
MDKWEYKVLFRLSEEGLNKWGEEGYEIYQIIPPVIPPEEGFSPPEVNAMRMIVILKRRKP